MSDQLSVGEARCAFYQALSKAQGAIEGALKGATNPAFKSKYADLGAVWDACREHLSANGIAVMQRPRTDFGDRITVSVQTILTHSAGHREEFPELTIPTTKPDAQGIGSAITYARRYSLMAAVGIAPEDDDGNAATQAHANGKGDAPAAASGAPRNEASRKLYSELQDDIDAADSLDALTEWHSNRLKEIQALPDGWRNNLKERYVARMADFNAEGAHYNAR